MLRTIGVTAAASTILALAACSDSADEPAGLTGDATTTPETAGSSAPSETPEVSEPDSPETDSNETNPEQPTSTFTQPYLPEERVVELRDTVPVESPADATDDETAVVAAFQHVQASWEQILWGVPFEQTGIER